MLRHYFKAKEEVYDCGAPFYDTGLGKPFKGTIRHDAQVAVNALFRLQCRLAEEAGDKQIIEQAVTISNYMYDEGDDHDLRYRMETFGDLDNEK